MTIFLPQDHFSLLEILRTRDFEVGRRIYCSLEFGPIGNDKVQSVKLLQTEQNDFSMSHSINQAITLHFLISDAIKNNHLYQKSLTVQEANLSGLAHVFTGNSLEAQVLSASPPPMQLSSPEAPTSKPEAFHCLFLTRRMVAE